MVLDAWLNAIDGSIVVDELERLERELYLADQRDGVRRSRSERMAAALVEMATRSATAPVDGRRPRPLFTVLVGDHSLAHLCELANGTVLPASQLLAHVDTALLETVLFDGPSTVVSVSSRRRFTGAVRRAVQVRDRRCRHPSGCDVPVSRCDVDHIVPWSRQGPTSQFNGRLECTTHNRHRDKHDHDAIPRPEPGRAIDRLDELRARLRWHCLRDPEQDDHDAEDHDGAGARAASS